VHRYAGVFRELHPVRHPVEGGKTTAPPFYRAVWRVLSDRLHVLPGLTPFSADRNVKGRLLVSSWYVRHLKRETKKFFMHTGKNKNLFPEGELEMKKRQNEMNSLVMPRRH
jgi:hypothetical protein